MSNYLLFGSEKIKYSYGIYIEHKGNKVNIVSDMIRKERGLRDDG